MIIIVTQASAIDVLSIEVTNTGRAGVWFLNWNVVARPSKDRLGMNDSNFSGMGVYGLCFDNKLIYIGSYLGGKDNCFSGDVVSSRWWTHIGGITARGNRVHLARKSLDALRREFGEDHSVVKGFLNSNDLMELHTDNGNLSPLRRLRFAANYSRDFLGAEPPSATLSRFRFVYARIHPSPDELDTSLLKEHILNCEKKLIKHFVPICNSTHVPKGKEPVLVNCDEFQEVLLEEISDGMVSTSFSHSDMVLVAGQIAQPVLGSCSSISVAETPLSVPVASYQDIEDSLKVHAQKCGASWHRTDTNGGDLRITTPSSSGQKLVVMTVKWQPRHGTFLIQSQCSVAQAKSYLGALGNHELVEITPSTEPQRSKIKVLAGQDRLAHLQKIMEAAITHGKSL